MEAVKSIYGFVDSGNVIALLFELILDAQVLQIEFSNKDGALGGVWIRGDQLIAAKILDHRGGEAIEALLTQPDLHSYIVYKLNPNDTADVEPIGSLSEMLYELVSAAHSSHSKSAISQAVSQPSSDAASATQTAVEGDAVEDFGDREKLAAEPSVTTALGAPTSEPPSADMPVLEPPVVEAANSEAAVAPIAEPTRTEPDLTQTDLTLAAQVSFETSAAIHSRAEPSAVPSPAQHSRPTPKAPKRATRRGRILAVVSPKGGVGKTTVSLNLAVALAQQGYSVVLVDADPQGGVTNSLMSSGEAPTGIYDVLMKRESFGSVVRSTKLENLRLMPAGHLLADEIISRSGQLVNPELWKRVLETVQRLVDIVIVDTPAGVQGVTTPILAAATHVIAVSQPEPLSLRSLPQLEQTLKALSQIGAAAELSGVILNMVQAERPVTLGVLETLSKKVVNAETLLEPMLIRSELLLRASSSAIPLMFASDPAYQPLKRVFENLATELLRRMNLEKSVAYEESFLIA